MICKYSAGRSKRQEALNRELLKEQGSQGKRELRTNTELEEEDRSMKEVVLGKKSKSQQKIQIRSHSQACLLKVRKLRHRFALIQAIF